jgi:hypothetical protein
MPAKGINQAHAIFDLGPGLAQVGEKGLSCPYLRGKYHAPLSQHAAQLQAFATQHFKGDCLFVFDSIQILPGDEQTPSVGHLIPDQARQSEWRRDP